jgi:hypothetical protein
MVSKKPSDGKASEKRAVKSDSKKITKKKPK